MFELFQQLLMIRNVLYEQISMLQAPTVKPVKAVNLLRNQLCG